MREVKRTSEVTITGELDFRDLQKLARNEWPDIPPGATVELFVSVPGGGDWSDTDLDLQEHPVQFTVKWRE